MPMFPSSGPQAAVPPIPMQLGLLPNPADPRTRPVGPLARMFGGGGAMRGRDERPAYTPEQVIKSQQSIADWFQSRPPAAGTAAGNIGTVGNSFMGTFIPTRAEERMRENERISADTARRAGSATTLEEAIAALAGGDPQQRNLATAQRLEGLDPLRRAQISEAEMKTRTAQRELEFQDQIFGAGGQPPPQAPAAGPQGGGGFRWPDTTGVRPSPEMSEGPVVQPPPAAPPGRMNLGGPMPQPEGAENMVLPAQALMEQSIQAAQNGQPATASATPPPITQDVLSVLGQRPLIERRAWYNLYKKDPAKAMTQLEEWGNPQAAQERVVRRESAEAQGKLQGAARANLPTALQTANSMIRNLDTVIDDPNRENVTGWQAADWYANPSGPGQPHLFGIPLNPLAYTPTAPSTETSRERIRQVQGQAFMQAYQAIRGAGAISDQEGAKAAAAITRLDNLKQGDADYTNALHDARREIFELYNVARAKAGLPPVPYQPHPSRAEGAQPPNAAAATERRSRNGKNYVKIGKDWYEE
jgi:hypothetical protein